MVAVLTRNTDSGDILGYDFGDKKDKDQMIRILAYEGVFLDPEDVDRLNENWTDDASKKEFKKLSRQVANDLSDQFDSQATMSDKIVYATAHASISFSPVDRERLGQEPYPDMYSEMEQIAREYMKKMDITDTQWVLTFHPGTRCPHMHLAFNRVRNDGTVISAKNERRRSMKACEEITATHELATGGEVERNLEALCDKRKVYAQMRLMAIDALTGACTIDEFEKNLQKKGILLTVTGQGLSYALESGEYYTKGSKLDRNALSYDKVETTLAQNLAARQAQEEAARQKAEAEAKAAAEKAAEEVRAAAKKAAQEAAKKAAAEAAKKAQEEAAKVENANKNRFWNTYNLHYKPLIEGLQKSIGDSFQMHDALKEDIRDCGSDISVRYDRLREINDQINQAKQNIERASNSEDLWNGLSVLVFLVNPIAGLVLGFVCGLVAEANRSAAIETRKALYAEAKAIRYDIDLLKEEQSQLRAKDAEVMKVAVEDKAAKKELIDEINALKAELDKPIEPPKHKFAFDFKTAARQTAAPVNRSQATTTVAVPTAKSAVDMYSILISAKDKNSLELALLDQKVVIEPIKDRYGGVADFKVTQASEGQVVNASSLVSGDRMRVMLDKWENLTGESPAYKLEIQREHRKKLADICTKMDAASPENAPRIPRNITFLPGGEIRVFYYNTGRQEEQNIMVDANGKMKFNGLILDVNTGTYTHQPSQHLPPRRSQEKSNGEGKGQGGRKR